MPPPPKKNKTLGKYLSELEYRNKLPTLSKELQILKSLDEKYFRYSCDVETCLLNFDRNG